jgi:hypothetical protein
MKHLAASAFIAIILLGCGERRDKQPPLADKIRCSEVGKRWFDPREIRASGNTLMRPEFAYNENLDTCLCMYGTFEESNHESSRQCAVWDILANRPLASFGNVNGKVTSEMTAEQFDTTASRLMGTQQSCAAPARWLD